MNLLENGIFENNNLSVVDERSATVQVFYFTFTSIEWPIHDLDYVNYVLQTKYLSFSNEFR